MLKVYIISPFPDILHPVLNESIMKKALEKEKVEFTIINLYDFLKDNERIDDYPYGGGEGMVLKAQPILDAFESINDNVDKVIFPTPDGRTLNHDISLKLSKKKVLVFICGHYKGIDQRIRDSIVDDEISIGDYVLTNGELSSLVIIDSIVRLIPGVINDYSSAMNDSFYNDLLDGPHYTRPRKIKNLYVPDVLLSGDHEKIKKWFLNQRIKKTKNRRNDLYIEYESKIMENKNE